MSFNRGLNMTKHNCFEIRFFPIVGDENLFEWKSQCDLLADIPF